MFPSFSLWKNNSEVSLILSFCVFLAAVETHKHGFSLSPEQCVVIMSLILSTLGIFTTWVLVRDVVKHEEHLKRNRRWNLFLSSGVIHPNSFMFSIGHWFLPLLFLISIITRYASLLIPSVIAALVSVTICCGSVYTLWGHVKHVCEFPLEADHIAEMKGTSWWKISVLRVDWGAKLSFFHLLGGALCVLVASYYEIARGHHVGSIVATGIVLGWVVSKAMPFVVVSSFGFDGLIVFTMLVVIALLDVLSLSFAKMDYMPSWAHWSQTIPGASDARVAFHISFLGMLAVSELLSLLWKFFRKLDVHQTWVLSIDVICLVVGLMLWVGIAMTWGLWVSNVHPIQVLIRMVYYKPWLLSIFVYWGISILSFVAFAVVAKTRISDIILRKVFHILCVPLFVPVMCYELKFMHLSFSYALGAFILVECFRKCGTSDIAIDIQSFFRSFTDARDRPEGIIVSHFSLLVGCALPLWLTGHQLKSSLVLYSGILSVSIGDTVACVLGVYAGRFNWPGSKKTIEGSVGGFLSTILSALLIQSICVDRTTSLTAIVVASALTSTVEAWSTSLDNICLPLVFHGSLLALFWSV